MTPVGDVDGDGHEDMLVQRVLGETESDCHSEAYVVLGAASGAELRLGALGARGITITDLPRCVPPWGVVALGDVNGDGKDDVGLGGDSQTNVRPVVIFGRAGGSSVSYLAPGSGGITFSMASDGAVRPTGIAAVGDVNGDGKADVGLGGGYGQPGAWRAVAGVVFGRAGGGTLSLGDPSTGGLLIGDPASATSPTAGAVVLGAGDVNHDGRADLITSVGGVRVVYGRAASGFIDTRAPGTGASLGGQDPFGVFAEIDAATIQDLDGDGARELINETQDELGKPEVTVVPSRHAAPHYDLAGTAVAPLRITASLGVLTELRVVGDATGDGKPDILSNAIYPIRDGAWVESQTGGVIVTHLISDVRPRKVDVRTATAGVRRLPYDNPAIGMRAALRFRGTAQPQIVQARLLGGLTVSDLIQEAEPPADTTKPVITSLAWDRSSVSTACSSPCWTPQRATLSFAVSEVSYMELELRRGSTVVSVTRGSVGTSHRPAGMPVEPIRWDLVPVRQDGTRLPNGTYTAVMKATDMAGNVGTLRTATIQVTG
ncbi:MAG: FG-GAP repeat domain-containing protein [Solirubrobacteraceae bacterium]